MPEAGAGGKAGLTGWQGMPSNRQMMRGRSAWGLLIRRKITILVGFRNLFDHE